MPCCQGFTLEIDGGPVVPAEGYGPMVSVKQAWDSQNFHRLRGAQKNRTWDKPTAQGGEPICQNCAVTKMPTRLAVPTRAVPLRVVQG